MRKPQQRAFYRVLIKKSPYHSGRVAESYCNQSMAKVLVNNTNGHIRFEGDWANSGKGVKNRYLGLKFLISGKVHYGWARLNVTINSFHEPEGTLTGYAYETVPGKAIIAGATKGPDDPEPTASLPLTPEPATLGTLALGAPGLSIWRREASVDTALGRN